MIRLRRTAAFIFGLFVVLAGISLRPVQAAQPLMITPTTFDFGWCPDNAKISAQFTVRNTGVDMIPITSVQPTCGCTATQFTPSALASNAETNVGLTFNTRGYAGTSFNKSAKVKTEDDVEYTVYMTGSVLDTNAKLIPNNGGIAGFEPGSKEKKKTIQLQNKGDKDLKVEIVQAPATWATAKLSATSVKAGASLPLEISVDSPFSEAKDTSVTLEASDDASTYRVTVAIRTGPSPSPLRATPTPAPAAPAKKPTPENKAAPKKKTGK